MSWFSFFVEFVIEEFFDGWFCLMKWIVPEQVLSRKCQKVCKVLVGLFSSLLLLSMVLGVCAMLSDDAYTKATGQYMLFAPMAISAIQILLGLVVHRLTGRKQFKTIDSKNADMIVTVTNGRCTKISFEKDYKGKAVIKENCRATVCFRTFDGKDIAHEQSSRCYAKFTLPGSFPHTLWKGRKIELYEDKFRVGTMVIEEILNSALDRNAEFKDREDILMDPIILNIALKRSLEWGRKFGMPLDNKIMRSIKNLSGNDIEKLANYITQVQEDIIWKIYYPQWDAQNEKVTIDGERVTAEKYPWIDKSNLATLSAQGTYYAWHG